MFHLKFNYGCEKSLQIFVLLETICNMKYLSIRFFQEYCSDVFLIYLQAALEQRLKDILYDGEWIERLDMVCNVDDLDMPKMEDESNAKSKGSDLQAKGTVHDDFKREMHL